MKKLFGAVVSLVAFGGSTFAEDAVTPVDAVWVNTTDAAPAWMTLGNWTDGEGAAIARPPTNVADSATFPVGPVANGYLQQIKLDIGTTSSIRKEIGLASLVDENPITRHAISLAGRYYSSCWEASAWLTLLDPNRFNGYITAYDADSSGSGTPGFGIRLPATAEKPLRLAGVSLAQPVDVQVPTAGTKATIDELYESGTLRKVGAGELVVKGTAGAGTAIYVAQGSLTLNGREPAETDANDDVPVKGAWMHLDADRADTMKWYDDPSDGRTYVTNWCDVRGNGVYAYFNPAHTNWNSSGSYVKSIHPPFVNETAVSGRRIVDFGRCRASDIESWGPLHCALSFSETRKDIREVFCAATLKYTGTATAVLGCWEDGGDCHPFHAGGAVIAGTDYGDKAVVYGDIIKNGLPSGNGVPWPDKYNLGVVSVGCTNNVRLSALGNERNYADRVGGVTVAEVILFTNELTHAERLLVHRYLQRKWVTRERADGVCEVGAVTLASNENSIGVPEGRTAVVQEVNAVGGTLVKTGKGTLTVGALTSSKRNTAVKVDVRGGTMKFGGLPAVTDVTAPAADPWLWLKAERQYFTSGADLGDGKEHISKWVDCRAEQTARYGEQTVETEQPFVQDDAVGDLAAVDFGAYKSGSANGAYWMNVVNNGGRKVYDGFVVQCENGTSVGPVFSNVNCDFYPGGQTRFLKAAADKELGWGTEAPYGAPVGRNALWTENGTVVDPTHPGQVDRTAGDWNVFGVSTLSPFSAAFLGNVDREKKTYGGGGCKIGEAVYYDRKLTPDERRQTIAYLMNKWQGKLPPSAEGVVKIEQMAFAAGEDAVIDTDAALTVEEVDMSGGTLIKRGSGAFDLPECATQVGATSIAVEGGTLALQGNPLKETLKKTSAHYDATDLSKMDYFVTEDADGSARTNLVNVYDQRLPSNRLTAFLYPNPASGEVACLTNPTLRTVQTASGVSMPVFDCGPQNTREAGAFQLSPSMTTVREAHVIYADGVTGSGGRAYDMAVFSDINFTINFLRGGTKILHSGYDTYLRNTLDGTMAVDDDVMPGMEARAYDLPAGFHLVSAWPAGDVAIGSIGDTHKCTVGGCQVGELIVFSEQLPEAESAYLRRSLTAKWLGGEVPVWTNALESLTVAEGATLSIGTDDTIVAESIDGSGTIEATAVVATGSLDLVAGKPLTVDGTFAQGGALAVTVACDYKPDVGEYPILTADALENVDLSTWTLSVALSSRRTAKFVRKGNTVYLVIEKSGFALIIK